MSNTCILKGSIGHIILHVGIYTMSSVIKVLKSNVIQRESLGKLWDFSNQSSHDNAVNKSCRLQ